MESAEERQGWQEVLDRLEALEAENRRLRRRLAELELHWSRGAIAGLQTAVVAGQGDKGTPAALDSQGRVEVETTWGGQKHKLRARVAAPWLAPGGGIQFLPRVGQGVYLAFENGSPELPVVVGYASSPHDPLPYDPTAEQHQPTCARTCDHQGDLYNPATGNQYKNVIRSPRPGQAGKVNEIALVDQPGQEEISLSSGGRLRLYSQGDCYHTVEGNHTQKISGDCHRRVEGKTTEVLAGERECTVQGSCQESHLQDSHLRVHGDRQEVFLGERASLTTGQATNASLALLQNIAVGAREDLNLNGSTTIDASNRVEIQFGTSEQVVNGMFNQMVNGSFSRVVDGLQTILVNGVGISTTNGAFTEVVDGAKVSQIVLQNQTTGIQVQEVGCQIGLRVLQMDAAVLKLGTSVLNNILSGLLIVE